MIRGFRLWIIAYKMNTFYHRQIIHLTLIKIITVYLVRTVLIKKTLLPVTPGLVYNDFFTYSFFTSGITEYQYINTPV